MSDEPFLEASLVDDDVLVVKLRGSLDAFTSDEFETEIRRHLEQGRSKIIVDCTFLGFISSIGIGALVALQKRLRDRGGTVKLAAIQGPAAEVIKMVRLDKVLDIHGDLQFARKSFAEQSSP